MGNNTVKRRIDEMDNNVEDALCSSIRTTQFSLQIDESCLPGIEALLLAYVRFIKDEKLVHKLLFAKELERKFRLRI
uniref:Zinc finger BED domain-containing protein 5 n=1 Tax=Trichuris muris TaxID=70415 RepID=A0A5S6Q576_TRIMR